MISMRKVPLWLDISDQTPKLHDRSRGGWRENGQNITQGQFWDDVLSSSGIEIRLRAFVLTIKFWSQSPLRKSLQFSLHSRFEKKPPFGERPWRGPWPLLSHDWGIFSSFSFFSAPPLASRRKRRRKFLICVKEYVIIPFRAAALLPHWTFIINYIRQRAHEANI